jgi:hypothetical protein
MSRSFLLRTKNASKLYRKPKHELYIQKGFFENRAGYEIMWKNIVEPGRPEMTSWRKRIAWWTPKAINTPAEYVILIAFPLQQWLRERRPMLPFTYITRRVFLFPSSSGICNFCMTYSQ